MRGENQRRRDRLPPRSRGVRPRQSRCHDPPGSPIRTPHPLGPSHFNHHRLREKVPSRLGPGGRQGRHRIPGARRTGLRPFRELRGGQSQPEPVTPFPLSRGAPGRGGRHPGAAPPRYQHRPEELDRVPGGATSRHGGRLHQHPRAPRLRHDQRPQQRSRRSLALQRGVRPDRGAIGHREKLPRHAVGYWLGPRRHHRYIWNQGRPPAQKLIHPSRERPGRHGRTVARRCVCSWHPSGATEAPQRADPYLPRRHPLGA